MIRALVLSVVLGSAVAHADTPPAPGDTPPAAAASDAPADPVALHLDRARDFQGRGDFAHARDELLAAYQLDPRPELLFALGQIEFNLEHYAQAIEYYERFNATSPDAEQAALAQQAIGAARIKLAQPRPAVPVTRPPPHRHWDRVDSGILALGGLAAVGGGALLYSTNGLANDHSGTLHSYDQRLDRARTLSLVAAGCFAGAAVATAVALLRWRFHLADTVIEVHANPSGAGVTFERPL
ncbi:MAG: Tetratricopeptide repeat protein [Myxococcales bacterium]|nr:Tetratricopeptide repeat protein [Myxococcales bacterium]